ncbi:hypothetical protein PLICRDRAFT_104097 [Plicaturopsis crispa FD-325 SS-3]|nr:hypothetical protein PLICRDRAFT_104097 [Plicaturopsis crispa FD-325 SS-3]
MAIAPKPPPLFPPVTPEYLLSFQFSAWYPIFSALSIKSTIIRPLSQDFCEYLDADGVLVPEGSENLLVNPGALMTPAESTLSDDDDSDEEEGETKRYAFPDLDSQIREAVKQYGGVFPKLNFSSPKDAAWVLPASSPLKCVSPSDVYLLLKSSDFVSHDLSAESVFEGCDPSAFEDAPPYELELVLRKWYSVDRSRELRCFVRQNVLLGISQRDANYYEFYNEPSTRNKILSTVEQFWQTNIKQQWPTRGDYTFDILLTRDLARAHILDFNPYAPRTDSLLFEYDELLDLLTRGVERPELRVIDSRIHPAATCNAPAHQHNMVPFEALSLSSGRGIGEFAELWQEEIKKTTEPDA